MRTLVACPEPEPEPRAKVAEWHTGASTTNTISETVMVHAVIFPIGTPLGEAS